MVWNLLNRHGTGSSSAVDLLVHPEAGLAGHVGGDDNGESAGIVGDDDKEAELVSVVHPKAAEVYTPVLNLSQVLFGMSSHVLQPCLLENGISCCMH